MDSEKLSPDDEVREVLKHGTLTMGFIGLAEALKSLTGYHHGESEDSQKLGLEIIGYMRKRMDEATKKYGLNFSLIATPAEGLSGRFVRIDAKRFGKIPGVTDREYYTNSFHIPVYFNISAYDKIKLEAPYHNLTNGGHISYIELDGDPLANLEAFEELPWSESEASTLRSCLDHTAAIVPYPGNYYVGRYAGFAFNAAYNDKEDPSDELLSYVDTINKELTRKRKEFDLMVDDEWQAIKDYMGFESFNDWKEYWAELNDLDIDSDTTYIQDNRDGAKEYTYVDWMDDNKITVESHQKWLNAVKYDVETRTYKEWVEK